MRNFFSLLLFVVLLICLGCGYTIIKIPKPTDYPPNTTAQMMAGISQKDITLPPGYPMSGYSINGRISRGYWIRPKVTALYLLDTKGTPFVFVTADLWAITSGQKMAVLKALSEDAKTSFIGESELLLSATHTHHSSGVIEFDKAFATSSIGFGFDEAAFGFTVRQIVSAIKEAIFSAEAATLSYTGEILEGIAQNRSIEAYYKNDTAERRQYLPPGLIALELNKFYRTEAEINSTIENKLSVLTIKNLKGKIKGVFASYPMHPTATGDATEVYSGDVFGLASSKAADLIASHQMPDTPIIAFYNGAEGDVAPQYRFHQRNDAVQIANALSTKIFDATQSDDQISIDGPITHRTETIDISNEEVELGEYDRNCYVGQPLKAKTAATPEVGASFMAGASDGRTSLSSFGISDGIVGDWDAQQGNKMRAIDFLSDKVLNQALPKLLRKGAKRYVKVMQARPDLQISIHQVGGVYFAGLPGEFTTMLGRRIKKTIEDSLPQGDKIISLVGLADSYISYVTTPCEYKAQYYEGASNAYGISTGALFENKYGNLAGKMADNPEKRKEIKTRFKTGKSVRFGPHHLGNLQVWNSKEGLHNLMVAANGYKVSFRDIPPDNEARDTILIERGQVVAYTFEDKVNTIKDWPKFYPTIHLQTASGTIVPLPEHIMTIDVYQNPPSLSRWTIRILNTEPFATNTPVQFVITSLSGAEVLRSGFFRIPPGFGIM